MRRLNQFLVSGVVALAFACDDKAAEQENTGVEERDRDASSANADSKPERDAAGNAPEGPDNPSAETPSGDSGGGGPAGSDPEGPAPNTPGPLAEAGVPASGTPTPGSPSPDPVGAGDAAIPTPPVGDYPLLFVTQVPIEGFVTLSSTFGNHRGSIQSAPRGGDLMLRYPDGTLRNLTQEAGYGSPGEQQDSQAIAVREPCVHWSGEKAVFSMVVGAPDEQYEVTDFRWQLYEVTGFGPNETASITKVSGQPTDYNNISPIYATNGTDLLFTSDRPRNGAAHLYPQLDEYESAATVVGIYRLNPSSAELVLLEHAPSGVFSPSIDSFGRVIFTKWDHLQRDQQALPDYGPLTYTDETEGAASSADFENAEVFPEPRETTGSVSGHRFNHFFPWEMNEDGSAEETLNHVGRHEFGGSYTEGSLIEDSNLSYYSPEEFHQNRHMLRGDGGTLHLRELPLEPGRYVATVAPEFYTAGSGGLVLIDGHPDKKGDQMTIVPLTAEGDGHYRNPLPLHNRSLIAVYTSEAEEAFVEYSEETLTNYDYRLYQLEQDGELYRASTPLTDGIEKRVTWWDPDVSYTWDGPLWELDPVEVVARPAPTPRASTLEAPEQAVFDAVGVEVEALRTWLRDNELALIVMRNVTLRDRGDLHQPFNLRVPGGVEAIATEGTVYDIAHLQVFQAEAVRAYDTIRGRRLLARPAPASPFTAAEPPGSTAVGLDGSVAAFVPARRALSWQLTDPSGEPVVRERNWLSFQAGEIRSCPVCHGLNSQSQIGTGVPENEPEALRALLENWQASTGP